MSVLAKTNPPEPRGYDEYLFFCPGCRCGHVYRTGGPGHPMWSWNGSLERPTFSPSLLNRWKARDGAQHVCHLFLEDGKLRFLGDCTHGLAGQTVDLPDMDYA